MKIKLTKVKIIRDGNTIVYRTCHAHEVPVMKAIHGRENVQVVEQDKSEVATAEVESVEREVERMETNYTDDLLTTVLGVDYAGAIAKSLADNTSKK